jgi:hypothetical protein
VLLPLRAYYHPVSVTTLVCITFMVSILMYYRTTVFASNSVAMDESANVGAESDTEGLNIVV